jgi:chromosome segregation ATPase
MVVERIKIEMCSSKLLELAKSIPDHADAITALAASIMQQEECFKSVCAALYRAMEELESAKKSHGHGHGSTAGGSSAALTKLRSEYVTVRERLDTTTAELKTAHRREAELRKLVDTATNELKAATQREKELRKRVDTQIHTHRRRKRNSFSAPQATTVETELVDRPAPHDTSKDTALTRPAAETKPADQPAPHDTPEETSLQEKTLEVSTHQGTFLQFLIWQ